MTKRTIDIFRKGRQKTIPNGFSWTTFLLGFWPSLFRGHIAFAAIMLLAEVTGYIVFISLLAGVGKVYGVISPVSLTILLLLPVGMRIAFSRIRNSRLLEWYVADGWLQFDNNIRVREADGTEWQPTPRSAKRKAASDTAFFPLS